MDMVPFKWYTDTTEIEELGLRAPRPVALPK